MNSCARTALLASVTASCLLADVTYNQTVKFTGGSILEMMQRMASNPIMGRLGGGNLKNAFQDQTYTVYVRGNKMARIGAINSMIYDLDAGTITTINSEKQTYTVLTFDEMRQRMDEAQRRMNRGQGGDLNFDVKVEKTGQTRNIEGQDASEILITMTAKSAGSNGQMVVKDHAWLVPPTPATLEIQDFYKRLSAKYAYAMAGFVPSLGAANGGLSAAMKEAFQQCGYPVLSDMDVSGVSSPMANNPMMGRGNSDPNVPFIQMESSSSNFAQGAVDDSKFTVPAGYKQEQPRGR
jgi:hypothetical protein